MSKYITVVFEYEDGAKLPLELSESFKNGGDFKDTKITAMSLEDEITKIEQLEAELNK